MGESLNCANTDIAKASIAELFMVTSSGWWNSARHRVRFRKFRSLTRSQGCADVQDAKVVESQAGISRNQTRAVYALATELGRAEQCMEEYGPSPHADSSWIVPESLTRTSSV